MAENAKQMAVRLMGEIDTASRSNYSKGEIKTMLNLIASRPEDDFGANATDPDEGCRGPANVDGLRRGDVFIAKLIGGKVRPWIVLSVRDGIISCVALSHGETAPRMVKSQCRFWASSWVGKTLTVFDESTAQREVTRPYTNLRHLAELEIEIATQHGMVVSPSIFKKVVSISEIVARVRA